MKEVTKKSFNCVNDFNSIHNFLSKTYDCGSYHNWDTARWSFNRYCEHNKEELISNRVWEDSVALWEDCRGNIIGVAHIEEPGDYFFQVDPNYKYLEEDMLLWAIDNCKKHHPTLDKMVLQCGHRDNKRKELYKKYQAFKVDVIDQKRSIELKDKYSTPELPNGYKIINLDGENLDACSKLSDLYTHVWPTSTYMPNCETVASFTKSIAYSKELSFIVVNDKDEYVAFTIAWIDSINKEAHFYPVTLDPDYLNSNILEIMLKNALNKLIVLGYDKANIDAWYKDEEVQVFEDLGFINNDYEECFHLKLKNI